MLEDSTVRPDDPTPAGAPDARGVAIGPCPPALRAEALDVLYRRLPSATRCGMIVELLRQAEAGGIDLSGLWLARRRGRAVGAMLTQSLAGRAAALWPPEVARGWKSGQLAAAMVREALESYRSRGARLAQALVDRGSPRRVGLELARGGLPYVTDLAYLGRPTADPLPLPPGIPPLQWEGFGPRSRGEFARALEQTYRGSLDMPELGGLRGLDDVLEGHRAKGHFDPDRWRIGRLPGDSSASAVLLLSAGEAGAWEVSYLGLVPSARGRGLGLASLAHAMELARPHASRLELAVDVRNSPAERLYRRAGFCPFDCRGVHVAVLGD